MMTSNERRDAREAAVRAFNLIARNAGLGPLASRPAPEAVIEFWRSLRSAVPAEEVQALERARQLWCDNGGVNLEDSLLQPDEGSELGIPFPGGEEPVPGHCRQVRADTPGFRLRSKAFMLTFNSLAFVASPDQWAAFQGWVEERKQRYRATYWSATLETSEAAVENGRVHLHCYFSWHGIEAKGVDHQTLDAWVFQGVRPRVDTNTEARSPWQWLKAAQHGHFYVAVHKSGTIFAATNYPAWGGLWAPDAAWVVSLWRHHKLDHAAFLALSVKLRDGHDRRKACADMVLASETTAGYAEERAAAKKLIQASAKPFKPLPDDIQQWKLQYETPAERYKMLVLYGPSCTGKSRLARSLFGEDRTLVVDVQHADHPDLKGFKRKLHKAVLLDEVSSPSFIVANKKLLQAHVDGAILGQSATQLYSYEVFLWRTPIILTTNNWELSAFSPADKNWLTTNCVDVHINSPVWQPDTLAASTTPAEHAPSFASADNASGVSPGSLPQAQPLASAAMAAGTRRPADSMEQCSGPENKRLC